MSHYLVIGKSFHNLLAAIRERGDTYTVLQDTTLPTPKNLEQEFIIQADFSNRQTLVADLKKLSQKPDGVISIYENYVLPTAWIAEELGLPGMPIAAAEACTDKFLMRSLFQQAPQKISPAFAHISSPEEAFEFANLHGYPLILKPANLAKSLLVTKNNDETELRTNYQKMIEQIERIYAQYAPHRQPKIIIEEFMSGSVHSVDAFIASDGTPQVLEHIVDYQTGYDIGFDDNFHYSRLIPSQLDQVVQEQLREVAALGIRSLGMRSSPAHVEIIVTNTGPQIVEIGARNGGYRERMHRLANGIDILGAALDLAIGKQASVAATTHEPCAVLELFPKQLGTFAGLAHEEELRALPSLQYLSIKPELGQIVGKSADGYKMCAVAILHHADQAQFQHDLDFLNEHVAVQVS